MICCWRCWMHIGFALWAKCQGTGLTECRLYLLQSPPPQLPTPPPTNTITIAASLHVLQTNSPTRHILTKDQAHERSMVVFKVGAQFNQVLLMGMCPKWWFSLTWFLATWPPFFIGFQLDPLHGLGWWKFDIMLRHVQPPPPPNSLKTYKEQLVQVNWN